MSGVLGTAVLSLRWAKTSPREGREHARSLLYVGVGLRADSDQPVPAPRSARASRRCVELNERPISKSKSGTLHGLVCLRKLCHMYVQTRRNEVSSTHPGVLTSCELRPGTRTLKPSP